MSPSSSNGNGGSRLAACLLSLSGLLTACSEPTGLRIAEERVQPNEAQIEAEMISLIRDISLVRRAEDTEGLIRRFNQPKTVGCLEGRMVVPELEPKLAVGVFARPAEFRSTMRFANATQFDDREQDLRGLSIKLFGVPGAVAVDGTRGIQDFTLNSYPALFAGTPNDFLSFVRASAEDSLLGFFLNPFDAHIGSLMIVLKARGNPASPLHENYFSTTPFAHGEGAAVKYSVRTCETPASEPPIGEPEDHEHYLRHALAKRVASGPLCLDFLVQFQSDPDLMPIEDASVEWPEHVSPYQRVAQILVEPHAFSDAPNLARCEAMQFNPWSGHAAHRPLGGINRVRKTLYQELGKFRTSENSMSRP